MQAFKYMLTIGLCAIIGSSALFAQNKSDILETSEGPLTMHFLGHGSVYFEFQGKTIYVDQFSRVADFSLLPKADAILITHEHGDHLDLDAISKIRTPRTIVGVSPVCRGKVERSTMIRIGATKNIGGFHVSAEPAYNLVHMREDGEPYHAKGQAASYVIMFGDKRIYVAGDTENTPEMKALKNIDVAFLPMNLPYTMTPEMVADAAKAFRPKILYPYHFGSSDTDHLIELLKDETDIEVRVRAFGMSR